MSELRFPMQPLSDLVTAIRDGTHGTHRRVTEGVPLLSAKNITANGEIVVDETDGLISEAEYQDLTRSFQLEPDDLLLTIVGSLGRRAIYSGQRVTFQRSVAYVRPQQRKIGSRFLFHWMGHPAFSAELARRSNATAQAGLYLGELANVSVPVPDEPEQREIAQILDTLDTAIRETEALIDKLKAVKQGLLHDLLTRGIDASGQLRPPPSEAPQLYKESPLGWIPKIWSYAKLDALVKIIDCKHVTPTYRPDGFAVVRPRNVKIEGLDLANVEYVSEADYKLMTDVHAPRRGDIILSRNASFGVPAFVDTDQPFAIGQDVIVITERLADTRFIFYCLQSEPLAKQIEQKSAGSTFGRINLSEIRELCVWSPSLDEQIAIVARLDSMDQRINGETIKAEKLRVTLNGLMDDLLTGRVRVTSLLKSMQQAAAQPGA